MAEPTQLVQVMKQEWASLGGSAADEEEFPVPINPREDVIETAAVTFQDALFRDQNVKIWRDGPDMKFKDQNNTPLTLTDLAAGGGGAVDFNRQLMEQTGAMVYIGDGDILLRV
jgi:hypothetical protein